MLFSTGGRGAIHVTLTDDLVSAGRKAGDLVNRIAALSGGKGGGRPHFASAGAGDPDRLPAARAAAPGVVSAWLGNGGLMMLADWLDRHTSRAPRRSAPASASTRSRSTPRPRAGDTSRRPAAMRSTSWWIIRVTGRWRSTCSPPMP